MFSNCCVFAFSLSSPMLLQLHYSPWDYQQVQTSSQYCSWHYISLDPSQYLWWYLEVLLMLQLIAEDFSYVITKGSNLLYSVINWYCGIYSTFKCFCYSAIYISYKYLFALLWDVSNIKLASDRPFTYWACVELWFLLPNTIVIQIWRWPPSFELVFIIALTISQSVTWYTLLKIILSSVFIVNMSLVLFTAPDNSI